MNDTTALTALESEFWPPNLTAAIEPPVTILKKAAAELSVRTNQVLEGRVQSSPARIGPGSLPKFFEISFQVRAPSLSNYTVELFSVQHDSRLYPVTFAGDAVEEVVEDGDQLQAQSDRELTDRLRVLLATAHVRKVISGLLAQTKET
ncbi:MAG: hypothetical protein WD872_09030 [Pirellulaceae bacterium]